MTTMTTWLRAARLHQWAKNGLLFLPAVAAHLAPTPSVLLVLLQAFFAFGLLASALYLMNDLADLEHDRAHPTKSLRPLAAGEITPGAALVAMAVFSALSLLLAVALPVRFLAAWLAYLVLSTSYTFLLKRVVVLDVVVLAALYTVRVVAGAAAVDVPLSRWFLAFSVFLFLSLALLKRLVEADAPRASPGAGAAEGEGEGEGDALPGRGWARGDEPILAGFGTAAAVAAALVYCLYITGDDVVTLYARPDVLWAGLPVLLYWLGRVWLLAHRGEMHDDPVVFALRDGVSWAVVALLLAIVGAAA